MELDQLAIRQKHNESIGTRSQRFIQRALLTYLVGPAVHLGVKGLFRIQVDGEERLAAIGEKNIFALQHFFEWDPLLLYYSAVWKTSLSIPHLVAQSVGSPLWTQTPLMRAISWHLGVMGSIKGHEPEQGAIERAARLLKADGPASVAIYPTGPIGREKTYSLYPGVGHLALYCPDVPITPIAFQGMQEVYWSDIAGLKRPEIRVSFGKSFCARDIHGGDEEAKIQVICQRIRSEWAQQADCVGELEFATR